MSNASRHKLNMDKLDLAYCAAWNAVRDMAASQSLDSGRAAELIREQIEPHIVGLRKFAENLVEENVRMASENLSQRRAKAKADREVVKREN